MIRPFELDATAGSADNTLGGTVNLPAPPGARQTKDAPLVKLSSVKLAPVMKIFCDSPPDQEIVNPDLSDIGRMIPNQFIPAAASGRFDSGPTRRWEQARWAISSLPYRRG